MRRRNADARERLPLCAPARQGSAWAAYFEPLRSTGPRASRSRTRLQGGGTGQFSRLQEEHPKTASKQRAFSRDLRILFLCGTTKVRQGRECSRRNPSVGGHAKEWLIVHPLGELARHCQEQGAAVSGGAVNRHHHRRALVRIQGHGQCRNVEVEIRSRLRVCVRQRNEKRSVL